MNNTITIEKVYQGFIARLPAGESGTGTTWAEAVGVLITLHPDKFNITGIRYARSPLTIDYRLRHDLDEYIYADGRHAR